MEVRESNCFFLLVLSDEGPVNLLGHPAFIDIRDPNTTAKDPREVFKQGRDGIRRQSSDEAA